MNPSVTCSCPIHKIPDTRMRLPRSGTQPVRHFARLSARLSACLSACLSASDAVYVSAAVACHRFA